MVARIDKSIGVALVHHFDTSFQMGEFHILLATFDHSPNIMEGNHSSIDTAGVEPPLVSDH